MVNGFLILGLLSDIELYFSPPDNISKVEVTLSGDEFKHAVKVMRKRTGNIIYITDGVGSIYKTQITIIKKEILIAQIIEIIKTENKFSNIFFCIPRLKNPDRFKFALEKSVELGIVNFIIFDAKRSIKVSSNVKRWEKIVLAAMKQSLRAFLPVIQVKTDLKEILNFGGEKIIFDQSGKSNFNFKCDQKKDYYFIFGPEGGLSEKEISMFEANQIYSLSSNRLRTETAILKAAASL